MAFDQRVSEPKLSKDGRLTVRTVKAGNRVLGHIETPKLKPGERAEGTFWASQDVIFLSVRDAALYLVPGVAAGMRIYGASKVGLRLADGSSYVTALASLTGCDLAPMGRGTLARLRVPLSLWEETLPPEQERVAMTLSKMRVPGGGRKSSMTA